MKKAPIHNRPIQNRTKALKKIKYNNPKEDLEEKIERLENRVNELERQIKEVIESSK